MEDYNIYHEIAERTQGDIYVGVVGPVRTGKSTFIKRFMELMVIPNIDNDYKKERAKDELPQSASGKSIHTTEPKFIPNEAVEINLQNNTKFKVRMVDCVGYIVKGALGYKEGETAKMVSTPWYENEIPFEEAAELGTKKVINDHSTIGLLVTTDGSITDIEREDYIDAEERVVKELKNINKPFIILLNSKTPESPDTIELGRNLEAKYDTPVQIIDVLNMKETNINLVFESILKEFPVSEVCLNVPSWIEKLNKKHWLKENIIKEIKGICSSVNKIRDIKKWTEAFSNTEYIMDTRISSMNMGDGTTSIDIVPEKHLFYRVLGEVCESEIKDENQLLTMVSVMHQAKKEFDKVAEALRDVRETGYGLVAPELKEMKLEEPRIVKQGNSYVVKLKASAPSLHFIKADIETEISPIMGSEKQSEELVSSLLEQFQNDPQKMWQSNMFGKSLEGLVKENMQNKLYKMPEDVQIKIQKTLEKIINEGNGGLICIIL